MGRSVNVPYGATIVTYIDMSEIKDEYEFDDMLDNIIYDLKAKMPSLTKSDKWLDREDRAILENELAYIGVSSYCDVMSLWIVPKDQYLDLAYNWISKIAHHIKQLGDLTKQGTMSNGVSVYKVKK